MASATTIRDGGISRRRSFVTAQQVPRLYRRDASEGIEVDGTLHAKIRQERGPSQADERTRQGEIVLSLSIAAEVAVTQVSEAVRCHRILWTSEDRYGNLRLAWVALLSRAQL